MKTLTAALGGIFLLSALPALAQSQSANPPEPEPPGRVLCFQVEALFVRAQQQAEDLKSAYDRICRTPSESGATCSARLRQQHGKDLERLERYRRWGKPLYQEYGTMCGGALNETLRLIGEAIDYVNT